MSPGVSVTEYGAILAPAGDGVSGATMRFPVEKSKNTTSALCDLKAVSVDQLTVPLAFTVWALARDAPAERTTPNTKTIAARRMKPPRLEEDWIPVGGPTQ